jgi:NAD(P)-dependent dehydrogenase (short-subunit alcohol dehydrogenase family)
MSAKRTLVTGGTRGIGRAIARAILDSGGRVMITGRDRDRVAESVRELEDGGAPGRVAGRALDVRDSRAVDDVIAATVTTFGGLDVVVNNAGVGLFGNAEVMTDAAWQEVMATNVSGPFHVMRAAIPRLRESGGGWIINIASLIARNPPAGRGAYAASKAALIALTESVMQEVRTDNIRVSVILPGSVATDFSGSATDADAWKLSPEDVADAVVGLLGHQSRSLPSRIEIRPSRPGRG